MSNQSDDVRHPEIEVKETLVKPHPLIRETRRYLKKAKPITDHNPYPGVLLPGEGCLVIRVSKQQLDRALRIYDAFLKHWEKMGGNVIVEFDRVYRKPETFAEYEGIREKIQLTEKFRRVPYQGKKGVLGGAPAFGFNPTGHLEFSNGIYGRVNCKDGEKPLELQLGEFCSALKKNIGRSKWNRLVEASVEQQRAAGIETRRQKEEARAAEEARREKLIDDANSWKQAADIRAYLEVMKAKMSTGELRVSNHEEHSQWMEWAFKQADNLDPLIGGSLSRNISSLK